MLLNRVFLIFVIPAYICSTARGQELFPSNSQALVEIHLFDSDARPVKLTFQLFGKNLGENFDGETDAEGIAKLLLPIGDECVLNFPDFPEYETLEIPPLAFRTYIFQIKYDPGLQGKLVPTEDQAVLQIRLKNFEEKPQKIATDLGISSRMVNYHIEQFTKNLEKARETLSLYFDYFIEKKLKSDLFDSDLKNEIEKLLREILSYSNQKQTFFVTSEQPDKNNPWLAKFVVDKLDG